MTAVHPLLRELRPVLNPGNFVFATVAGNQHVPPAGIIASIREPEGLSVILEESEAKWLGLSPALRCAWITLAVHTGLDDVGVTAGFTSALARAGISCNVVAGVRHDHVFVPLEQAGAAMGVLASLAAPAQGADLRSRERA
jgi:hypothetical protein